MHIKNENYAINFFSSHMLHSWWDDQKQVILIVQSNVFYNFTEKYPLESVNDFISSNKVLFSIQACCIFV